MRRLLPIALLAAGCGHEPAPRSAPALPVRAVSVARAELRTRPSLEEVVGTVRARDQATIAPTLGGTVAEVRVVVGRRVRAGEVLVRLSARDIEARLEQARAVHALARLESDRAAALRKAEAISSAQLDAAQSQLRVAEAAQSEARTLADHAVLRAPFDGVVTAKLVNVGDTAMPGQALLVIEAPDALRFEARVPEARVRGLGLGRTLPLRLEGLDAEIAATVAEIDPVADATTRTVLIKLDLPAERRVRSGHFGRLLVPSSDEQALTVPAAAIVRRGQLEAVYVVDGGVARLRLVRTARERAGEIEVVSGLAGGEQVATAGATQLLDGQPVEVQP